MNSFINSFAESDLFGKAIFLSLFILSIISWVILIYKVRIHHQSKKVCFEFQEVFEKHKKMPLNLVFDRPKHAFAMNFFFNLYQILKEKTLAILERNRFFLGKQNQKDVYLSEADLKLLETHLAASISLQVNRLEKNVFILSTVVTLAPFLGLLGTVWGILITFSELSFQTSNSHMLSGLSMALSTTVVGLIVAIPALVAYNYLKNSSRDFRKEMEHFSHRLISTIEMQYRKNL